MTDPIETMVKRAFAARMEHEGADHAVWGWRYQVQREELQRDMKAALAALREHYAIVPREPTEAQWGGLARDIMMWLSFERPTPRKLFQHLTGSGRAIPQWLRDEPELQHLDHVPSKGTRCAIIYKAMLKAGEV